VKRLQKRRRKKKRRNTSRNEPLLLYWKSQNDASNSEKKELRCHERKRWVKSTCREWIRVLLRIHKKEKKMPFNAIKEEEKKRGELPVRKIREEGKGKDEGAYSREGEEIKEVVMRVIKRCEEPLRRKRKEGAASHDETLGNRGRGKREHARFGVGREREEGNIQHGRRDQARKTCIELEAIGGEKEGRHFGKNKKKQFDGEGGAFDLREPVLNFS